MAADGTERRLAAILFTDIVGYTALMARDEEAGRRARDRHEALVSRRVEQYHGEYVERTGDETLSSFPSALDAVDCALAIQAELRDDPALQIRAGIHLGDVTFDAGGVSGDGINVASRIRPLAEPGGICISDEVRHSVRGHPNFALRPLGEQQLRNVDRPVAVFAVTGTAAAPRPLPALRPGERRTARWVAPLVGGLALVAVGAWWWNRPAAEAAPIRSVAVLPFADLSPGRDQEYFADGMSEEIINALSHVEGLRVVARTSAFAFKGKGADIREIGKQLDVGAVVEGSVRKAGNRLRITAQLIRVEDGFHIWSESYDRELEDVFAIQSEIARATVGAAKLRLASDAPVVRRPTENIRAYELYLTGLHFGHQVTPEGLRQAIDYVEQALEADPNFALAYVLLADAYAYEVVLSFWGTLKADIPQQRARNEALLLQAETALTRAISIDDALGEAHASLGGLRVAQWRWRDAERELQLALQLNPGNAGVHIRRGHLFAAMGRPEAALDAFRRAVELDPLSLTINQEAGAWLLYWTDYDAAIERMRRTVMLNHPYPPYLLARAYFEKGLESKALEAFLGSVLFPPEFKPELQAAFEVSGFRGVLRRTLERADPQYTLCAPILTSIMAFLGEGDLLFPCLQEVVDLHGPIVHVMSDPWYDDYRSDPRFQDILRQIGLDEYR